MATPAESDSPTLPVPPVERWLAPVTRFLHVQAASGLVLLACTATALGLANSPMAEWFALLWKTRITFSLGVFTLEGDVGHLIAIVDDVAAVLIIAFLFTDTLAWAWLGAAAGAFAVIYMFNRIGVRQVAVYVVVGAFIWVGFLKSGVHPTVAGVLLGCMPSTAALSCSNPCAKTASRCSPGTPRTGSSSRAQASPGSRPFS